MDKIQLVGLKEQYRSIKADIDSAVLGVLGKGNFILGENVKSLEQEMAKYCGVKFGIGVASGTDALDLSLMALGIKEGDEVITTPFTFIATSEAISQAGARPVFVDIDLESFNIDVTLIRSKITKNTKAIIPVHIYGQPCNMDEIQKIAKEFNLTIIEDCAQAIGAEFKGKRVGSFGKAGCFSFFPSKNLGAFGDGGMIVTDDEELTKKLKMLRVHGSKDKYYHIMEGRNSRLDEMQAAIVRVKLNHIDKWNQLRIKWASAFNNNLADLQKADFVILPKEVSGVKHVYHIYGLRAKDRDGLKAYLEENGVQTGVHYPIPLHLQEVYRDLGYKKSDFPNAESLAKDIISLPLYPELTQEQVDYISKCIKDFYHK